MLNRLKGGFYCSFVEAEYIFINFLIYILINLTCSYFKIFKNIARIFMPSVIKNKIII